MLSGVVLVAMLAPPANLNILFLGNSHTTFNDVPAMVRQLIQSDGSGRQVATKLHGAAFVEELAKSADLRRDIQSGNYNVMVMQGAKLSSSHRYEYDHSGAIEIANLAKRYRIDVWLFAEWPRRGWKETDYILKEYREIADPSGARIIPTCKAFDRLLAGGFKQELWQGDGNHATLLGSFVAACTIAAHIAPNAPKSPSWRPSSVDVRTADQIKRIAREIAENPR